MFYFGDFVRRKGQSLRIGMVERIDGDTVYVRWHKDGKGMPISCALIELRI